MGENIVSSIKIIVGAIVYLTVSIKRAIGGISAGYHDNLSEEGIRRHRVLLILQGLVNISVKLVVVLGCKSTVSNFGNIVVRILAIIHVAGMASRVPCRDLAYIACKQHKTGGIITCRWVIVEPLKVCFDGCCGISHCLIVGISCNDLETFAGFPGNKPFQGIFKGRIGNDHIGSGRGGDQ